ncbi:MAG: glycosyltransferase family 2 protein [Akkermansiaceae bacterium]
MSNKTSTMVESKTDQLLSVGITTKGRLRELRQTLALLQDSELRDCEVILIDDGGNGDFVEEGEFDLNLRILRYEKSKGLVQRRNELARLCTTKYLMSLDDDSSPERGSVMDALEILEGDKDIASIALNLHNSNTRPLDTHASDFVARYFVGCGHIHDVDVFRKLGGYTGALFYGHEEREYSLKLARASMKIIHLNRYVVAHRKSDINRVVGYNPRPIRNLGWINATYLGVVPNIIELYSLLKGKKLDQIKRELKDYFRGMSERQRVNKLNFAQYWGWKRSKTPTVA